MRYTTDEDLPEPPHLKRLRQMVMVLLVVLMLGILTIAGTIVIRLGFGGGAEGVAAEGITLPEGEIVSTGQGDGTVLFVVRGEDGGDVLHVFDASTGVPLSQTKIDRE